MEIDNKLSKLFSKKKKQANDLDRKLSTSCQQFFTQSIQFLPASGPDSHLEHLKSLYKPLNKLTLTPSNVPMETSPSPSFDPDPIPSPNKLLFDGESLEMCWKRVRSIGAGLYNMGNTCFLNSVLQCLAYTPPLVNYLLSGKHKEQCTMSGFCTMCAFQSHCGSVLTSPHSCIKPSQIVHHLRAISKHFRLGRQEDAHEFLRYFIDGMQRSCLHGYPAKLDPHSKATTIVHQIFGGYHRSQVKCLECERTSNTYDPLLDLSTDIKNCTTLLKALHRSTRPDILEGDNCYACPFCKKMTKAQKRFTIQRLPRVLTVQLKRFDFNSLFGGKINKSVTYPEHIDMRPFMSVTQGPSEWYRLYAVLVHSGFSCHSGHYYCYVRNSNNSWYCMNDSHVSQANLTTVLQQEAYLLFYIKDSKHSSVSKQQGIKSDPNFLSSSKKPVVCLDKVSQLPRKPTGVVPPSPKIIAANPPITMATNKATPLNKPVFIPRQIKATNKVKKSPKDKVKKFVVPPSLSPVYESSEENIPETTSINPATPVDQRPIRFIGPALPPIQDEHKPSLVAVVASKPHFKPVAMVKPSLHIDNSKLDKKSPTCTPSHLTLRHTPTPPPKHTPTPPLVSPSHTPPNSHPQVDSTTSGDVPMSPKLVPYGPDLSSDHVTSTLGQTTPSPNTSLTFHFNSSRKHSKKRKKKKNRKHSDIELYESDSSHHGNGTDDIISSKKREKGCKKRDKTPLSRNKEHKSRHRKRSVSPELSWKRYRSRSRSYSPVRKSSQTHTSPTPHRHAHTHTPHRHRHHSHRGSERGLHSHKERRYSTGEVGSKVNEEFRVKRKRHRHHDRGQSSDCYQSGDDPDNKRHKQQGPELVWDSVKKCTPQSWNGQKRSSVLEQLTSGDRLGVKSWAGGESVLECGTLTEGRRNDNRDSWDEELDAGKVKKVKKRKEEFSSSSGNKFQDMHNKRKGSHYHHDYKPHKWHRRHTSN